MEEKDFLSKEDLAKAKEEAQKTLRQYRMFAFKGDLIKLASAFIIAAALDGFIKTFTSAILMPLINFIVLHSVGDWRNAHWTPVSGLTLEVGKAVDSTLNMFLITLMLFFVIKWLGKLEPPEPPVPPLPPRKRRKRTFHKEQE